MGQTCAACGAENREGARFCDSCGAPQQQGCPTCGAEPRPGARFCDTCGTPLGGAAAPPALAPPPPAAGELRHVSVLFVDIVGYTALSETRDAEDVRALLSRYFETARTVVGRYGGTIEKFIGDAVMAVWGAPAAREDDGERAVRAALELVDAVQAFGESVGAPALRARAGVVTGQAAAVANPEEGIVVGDRVNVAARVQSVAQPGTVYVDDVTRTVSAAAIAYADAGEHAVKGKTEPLHLWHAVRVVGGAGGALREEGVVAPFLGRDHELRVLKDAFHQAQERRGVRLVSVSGAAGVGKSRLLQELDHYVDGLADVVLWHAGRCLAYGDGVAYWALAQMVRTRLGIEEEEDAETAAAKLLVGVERHVADPAERAHVLPRLGALLGTAQPGLDRQDLFSGWRLFLERLAEQTPVVLAFEDLQWADEGLLDFIGHLLEWAGSVPIFVLALARAELADRVPDWPPRRPGTTELHLEPLTRDTMATMLGELVADLPAEAADRIVDQAEGIPLYALEVVRALEDRGSLVARDGRLAVAGDLGELTVPPTLTALLTARLDALPAAERSLVRTVSVLGGSFPRAAAAALSDLDATTLDGTLAALTRKSVLVVRADPLSPERGQYAFGQGLLRSVAYDSLTKRERGPLHLAAADHLRAAFADDGEDVAEVIAAHELDAFRAATPDDAETLRPRVVASLRRAAGRADTTGAPAAAARLLESAAELQEGAERLASQEAAGDAYERAGRYAEAEALQTAVLNTFRRRGNASDAGRVAAALGRTLWRSGRNSAAAAVVRPALEALGPDVVDPVVAALHVTLANALLTAKDDASADHVDKAREIAARAGDHETLVRAMNIYAVSLSLRGRHVESLVVYAGLVDLTARDGYEHDQVIASSNVGDTLLRTGLPGAEGPIETGMALAARRGDRILLEIASANLAHAHRRAGRWDALEALVAQEPDAYPMVWGVVVALDRGDAALAEQRLAGIAGMRETEDAEVLAWFDVLDARLAWTAAPGPDTAGVLLEVLRGVVDGIGLGGEPLQAGWREAVDAGLQTGRIAEAEALVAHLGAEADGLLGVHQLAERVRGQALLDAARGGDDTVEERLRDSIAQFAPAHPVEAARTQADLGRWLQAQGRAEEAQPLLAAAAAVLEPLGVATPPAAPSPAPR